MSDFSTIYANRLGIWGLTSGFLGGMSRVASSVNKGAVIGIVMGVADAFLFYPIEKIVAISFEDDKSQDDPKNLEFDHHYPSNMKANMADVALIVGRIATITLVMGAAVALGVISLPMGLIAGGFVVVDYAATRLENIILRHSDDLKGCAAVITGAIKVGIIVAGIFALIHVGVFSLAVGIPLGIAASILAIAGTIYRHNHPDVPETSS